MHIQGLLRSWVRGSVVGGAGLLVAILGLASVVGWHAGIPSLTRWHSTFPIMVYDTAWGLTAGGVGLVAFASGWSRTARAVGGGLVLLGLGHLGLSLGLGIEYRDFLPHPIPADMDAAGRLARMAPSAALSFVWIGLVYLAEGDGRGRAWARISFTSAILLMAFASFLGMLTGYGFYLWGSVFLGMALPTALAFGCLGLALLSREWEAAPRRVGGWPEWAPMPTAALVLGFAFVLGQSQQAELRRALEQRDAERIDRAAQQVGAALDALLEHLEALNLGDALAVRAEATWLAAHQVGVRSIAWERADGEPKALYGPLPPEGQKAGWADRTTLVLETASRPEGRLRAVVEVEPWGRSILQPVIPAGASILLGPLLGPATRPPWRYSEPATLTRPFAGGGTAGVIELEADPRRRTSGRRNTLAILITGGAFAGLAGGLVGIAQRSRERAARLAIEMEARLKAERHQQEFLAVVSHELRTPLTAIEGALKLVKHLTSATLGDQELELVEMANRNALKLHRLVNDLLDMEKLSTGRVKVVLEAVECGALVDAAVKVHEPYSRARGITCHFESPGIPIWIHADPHRLEQVVANLLSNATKFSPAGGEVRVRLEAHGSEVRLEVQDRGTGIPEAFQEKIFQPFSQAEGPNVRQMGGSGLGLAISKALVEVMGGQIGYEPREGGGTTFWVAFPLSSP